MSTIREWVIHIRYPYTAGIIAVIWIGSAIFAWLRPEVHPELFVGGAGIATLIIASIGFSARR